SCHVRLPFTLQPTLFLSLLFQVSTSYQDAPTPLEPSENSSSHSTQYSLSSRKYVSVVSSSPLAHTLTNSSSLSDHSTSLSRSIVQPLEDSSNMVNGRQGRQPEASPFWQSRRDRTRTPRTPPRP